MDAKQTTKVSKFLSLVLRHKPEQIGITLDPAGWVSVRELIDKCGAAGMPLTLVELDAIVSMNGKQRFAFSEDRERIRANQGHSVTVQLGYTPTSPPAILYHGTHEHAVQSILATGIVKGSRHHVHLTADPWTAVTVGERRGVAVVIAVEAGDMDRDGHVFYLSDNQVWLTDHVPPRYLRVKEVGNEP